MRSSTIVTRGWTLLVGLTLPLGGLLACGDDDGAAHSSATGTAGDGDSTTAGDGDGDAAVSLNFTAVVGSQAVACGTEYTLGSADTTATLADFRLFVSNVRLIDDGGAEVPVALTQDGKWQYESLALLDFEDGSGACQDGGTTDLNGAVVGTVPAGTYDGVAFDLGVPFEFNHSDTATAPSPLNLPSMFWNWQGGYKFARIDVRPTGGDPWNVHLGSTGCVSDGPTDAPEAECGKPNRPSVRLTGFDPLTTPIQMDLAALLEGVDVSSNTMDTPPGCMSNPTDTAECPALFSNLGLSFDSGACESGCADQSFFSAG